MSPGRGLPAYEVASESIEPLVTKDNGPKIGAVPLLGGEAGSPSNNVAGAEAYLDAKFHLELSNRLATIHQRHRLDRQRTVC